MNTSAVAKKLGVSTSTIKRWVKQLELSLERNEMGHYHYTEEDMETLIAYQHQQNEALKVYQEIATSKEPRQGVAHVTVSNSPDRINDRLETLEQMVRSKADQVVAYQILQHRKELDELYDIIEKLSARIVQLENNGSTPKISYPDPEPQQVPPSLPKRSKKSSMLKNVFRSSQKHSS